MLQVLDRLGVWYRAGINGTITGLRVEEAMSSLPADCDRSFAHQLLTAAETAFCVANWRREKEPDDKEE